MTKFRNYNVVKVYLSDEEMARVDLAIQYYKLRKSGPQSYNALFIWAFSKLIESDQELRAFIENSLAFVKRIQGQQQQQAGQEAGAKT
jgi:hypothetical protein